VGIKRCQELDNGLFDREVDLSVLGTVSTATPNYLRLRLTTTVDLERWWKKGVCYHDWWSKLSPTVSIVTSGAHEIDLMYVSDILHSHQ
jgi:hypothetical protein